MTYLDLINHFWSIYRDEEFSSNEVHLYLFLLNEYNIRGRQNPFEYPNKRIVLATGMSEKTVIEVRNRLQQKGLFTFESGKRNAKSPVYYFPYESKTVSKKVSKKVSKTVSKKVSKKVNLKYKENTENTEYKSKENIKEYTSDEVLKKDELSSRNNLNYENIRLCFNQMFKGKLPLIGLMDDKRKAAVRARAATHGKEAIREVFKKVEASAYLLGKNDKNWQCTYDWIMKPTNFIKILEGNYDARTNSARESVSNLKDLAANILQQSESKVH